MKFLKYWFPVIFYSGIIFYASSVANVTIPMAELHFDSILHVFVYLPFGFLVARGIFNSKPSVSGKGLVWLTCLTTFVYALSDEYHQFHVVGRDAEIMDFIADTIGGTIGGSLYLLFIRKHTNP